MKWQLIDLDDGYFVVRFQMCEDLEYVLTGGTKYKVNPIMESQAMGRFDRTCDELDITKPLTSSLDVDDRAIWVENVRNSLGPNFNRKKTGNVCNLGKISGSNKAGSESPSHVVETTRKSVVYRKVVDTTLVVINSRKVMHAVKNEKYGNFLLGGSRFVFLANEVVEEPSGKKDLSQSFLCPLDMTQLRDISLCSTIYKVISEIIVQRLRNLMHKLVSPNQVAFVFGRQIQDNIAVAQEGHTNDKNFVHLLKWDMVCLPESNGDAIKDTFLVSIAWSPPSTRWVKLNVDGSCDSNSGIITVGGWGVEKPLEELVKMFCFKQECWEYPES
ncbi:hypothetical protein Ddye_020230 [Dipteronia dyeriana]|uniref:Reverse transcriptase n=1 Tax=Dipteronia dyeriana TaxID=168575 RepID=A0AAD9TZC6_9ROSI|nr:hypothetical protein Ddye_020230 [Dipteronia dyeriana]